MVDLNGVLLGWVVGVATGIFLAYKIAQHANNKRRPEKPYVDPLWSPGVESPIFENNNKKRLR